MKKIKETLNMAFSGASIIIKSGFILGITILLLFCSFMAYVFIDADAQGEYITTVFCAGPVIIFGLGLFMMLLILVIWLLSDLKEVTK